MGKSSKAPSYATTSYDTGGLFGSSTTSKKGTTYTPTSSITDAGNSAWNGLISTMNSLSSGDYSSDANYQAYADNLKKQMTQNYDTSVLSQLANKGLMRSSGLQAATNAFADTLADQTTNLYDSYTNTLSNNLSNYRNVLNNLYSYITGINSGSQSGSNSISNYNLQQSQANDNSALWQALVNIAGTTAASDINVKKNIRKIGEYNNMNLYEFEYKDGYDLPKGKQIGVMAQEVEKVNPDAVTEINGIKHVDYSKL